MIKRGQRTQHATHHCHGMRVVAEAVQERAEGFMHHGVMRYFVFKRGKLLCIWQMAVHQQIGHFGKVRVFCQLFDRIAAIHQDTGIAIDISDRTTATRRGHEARIVGEITGFFVEFADIDAIGTQRAGVNRKLDVFIAGVKDDALVIGHGRLLEFYAVVVNDSALQP